MSLVKATDIVLQISPWPFFVVALSPQVDVTPERDGEDVVWVQVTTRQPAVALEESL